MSLLVMINYMMVCTMFPAAVVRATGHDQFDCLVFAMMLKARLL